MTGRNWNSHAAMHPPTCRPLSGTQGVLKSALIAAILSCIIWCPPLNAQQSTPKVQIKDVIWGFDGRIQPGHFNPVSILLDNQTADAIDGDVFLRRSSSLLGSKGTRYRKTVYLSAAGRLWVQFYPLISDPFTVEWTLEYSPRNAAGRSPIGSFQQARAVDSTNGQQTQSARSRAQYVIIDRSDTPTRIPSALQHFPENLFPPYATATSGLHTVVLDFMPDWDEPRANAFLSWLQAGGHVHVLQNRQSEFPEFSGALTELSQPLQQFQVGLGTVTRHALQRGAVTEEFLEQAAAGQPGMDLRNSPVDGENLEDAGDSMEDDGFLPETSVVEGELYRQMNDNSRPDHAWWLIFLLSLLYILMIFPGCYWVSKKRQLHFLTTYGCVVGLSILFSLVFLLIGRRGYGESTWMQSVMIARQSPTGELMVDRWSSFFVTQGDNYRVSPKNQQAVLAISDDASSSQAEATSGKDAELAVRIPPYSAQPFRSRQLLSTDVWDVSIQDMSRQSNSLVRLTIALGDNFPELTESSECYVVAGNRVYSMKLNSDKTELQLQGVKRRFTEFCVADFDVRFGFGFSFANENKDNRTDDEVYVDQLLPNLVHLSILNDRVTSPKNFAMPDDRIRLLALTKLTDDLHIDLSTEARRTGWVLFSKDLLVD